VVLWEGGVRVGGGGVWRYWGMEGSESLLPSGGHGGSVHDLEAKFTLPAYWGCVGLGALWG
jgi:hypothetical protein